jgi:hypothetical protein
VFGVGWAPNFGALATLVGIRTGGDAAQSGE